MEPAMPKQRVWGMVAEKLFFQVELILCVLAPRGREQAGRVGENLGDCCFNFEQLKHKPYSTKGSQLQMPENGLPKGWHTEQNCLTQLQGNSEEGTILTQLSRSMQLPFPGLWGC